MKVVFDTFAWIEFFEGSKKGKVVNKYLNGNEVITSSIVLLELSYKADKEGWNFKQILSFINTNSEIIGINEKFVLGFGRLYNKVKKKIRSISMADIIIMHTTKLNEAKVLTGDKHFKGLKEAIMLK